MLYCDQLPKQNRQRQIKHAALWSVAKEEQAEMTKHAALWSVAQEEQADN